MEIVIPNNNTKTFQAIKDFVFDLNVVFGTKGRKTPLDLYYRLIYHIEASASNQHVGIEKSVIGFKVFFANYEAKLETYDSFLLLPRDTIIRYDKSENAYLEIQKYIYKSKSNPDQCEAIYKHLLTIAATIDPSEKNIKALGCDPILEKMGLGGNSAEARHVRNIVAKAKAAAANADGDDPMSVIKSVAQAGVFGDVMKGLQTGAETGALSVEKLMPMMAQSLSVLTGQDEGTGFDMDQIILGVQSVMGNAQSDGDEGGANIDLSNVAETVLSSFGLDTDGVDIKETIGSMMENFDPTSFMSNIMGNSLEEKDSDQNNVHFVERSHIPTILQQFESAGLNITVVDENNVDQICAGKGFVEDYDDVD